MGTATESGTGKAVSSQLVLRTPSAALSEAAEQWEVVSESIELSPEVQRRVRVMQQLMAAQGTKSYAKVQQQAARSLNISVRSLRRLISAWQKSGIAGLSRQVRSDQGNVKTSQQWQDFIVKTYRDGNRGSRKMSPAQVAIQVRARAQAIGEENYPGRTTVYRILEPVIEKQQQKRSPGCSGNALWSWRRCSSSMPG